MRIDLSGKRALVVGVGDDRGFALPIARTLAEAGASVCAGVWPPMFSILEGHLKRGTYRPVMTWATGELQFERLYPVDVAFDRAADLPEELRASRRYRDKGDVSIEGLANRLEDDFGSSCLNIIVHSIANAPEIQRDLLDTSRSGYLDAISVSTYSFLSLIRHLGPLLQPYSAAVTLSYLAGQRVVPGYGGGMSSAKAALEHDTRVLAYQAGRRWGVRINAVSPGPFPSRAASAVGPIETMIDRFRDAAPIQRAITAEEVADAVAFLVSSRGSGITGQTIFVDNGFHVLAGGALA